MSEEKFKRLTKNGQTAVLISKGYGAGWSTWNGDDPGLALDGDIAQAILNKDKELALKIAHERYGDFYDGGIDGLCVEWIPSDMLFEIDEYDGKETLRLMGDANYLRS